MPGWGSNAAAATAPERTDASTSKTRLLTLEGHAHFRHRLVLSLLTRRPVRIQNIRSHQDEPGLRDYEISFLRLLERLSNGSIVEISYTGTSVLFSPGTLIGGKHVVQCGTARPVGWYIEPILALAPFCKNELVLTCEGITTDDQNASVDILRLSLLPHLALFLPSPEGLELRASLLPITEAAYADCEEQITKRGYAPLGGGAVTLRCPTVKQLKPGLDFIKPGRVQKIRGIAHSLRVSPQFSNRMVSAARSVLNRYIPDIYIYTDVYKGDESGKSPGYALTLTSTSTTGVIHSSEGCTSAMNTTNKDSQQNTPEDLAISVAQSLLLEIERGSCIDRGCETLVLTLMAMGKEGDVVRCLISSPLDAFLVQHLRDLHDFTGVAFKLREVDQDSPASSTAIQAACVPPGYSAIAARAK